MRKICGVLGIAVLVVWALLAVSCERGEPVEVETVEVDTSKESGDSTILGPIGIDPGGGGLHGAIDWQVNGQAAGSASPLNQIRSDMINGPYNALRVSYLVSGAVKECVVEELSYEVKAHPGVPSYRVGVKIVNGDFAWKIGNENLDYPPCTSHKNGCTDGDSATCCGSGIPYLLWGEGQGNVMISPAASCSGIQNAGNVWYTLIP